MRTWSGIPRKRQRSSRFSTRIQKVEMIKHPERIDSGCFRISSLLPIQPPKVDTFAFQCMMEHIEISVHKLLISRIKGDHLEEWKNAGANQSLASYEMYIQERPSDKKTYMSSRRITTQSFRHLVVKFLKCTDPICWMNIRRNL